MNVMVKTYNSETFDNFAELVLVTEEDLNNPQTQVLKLLSATGYHAKAGEAVVVVAENQGDYKKFLAAGLGKKEKCKLETWKKALASAVKEAKKRKIPVLIADMNQIKISEEPENNTRIAAETMILAGYEFIKYKSKDQKDSDVETELESLDIFILSAEEQALQEATLLAENTKLVRDLINEPANVMTPKALAKAAQKAGSEAGFEVQIFDKDQIEEMNMGAFLAVAKGSANKPKLIVMRYFNNPDQMEQIHGIVGKGLIFDTGGYSIKPTAGMLEMKSDMSGAAAVIGSFKAIAQAKLKVNVVGVIAACENMISGKSYRPADIITSMAGKTIYIGNTDAEGRLTLADAIHYIIEKEKVSNVLDIATLTGAAQVALGDTTTPVISNNDELYAELEKASQEADERIWRLPIFDDYREKIKAKEADLTNSAGNPGTITAAAFLEAFVQEKPWIHFDIAGTSWTEKPYDYYSAGATGYGVRTIYHWLKNK